MNEFLDRLERILQRRLDTAFIVEMDELKADLYAELLSILRELKQDENQGLPPQPNPS